MTRASRAILATGDRDERIVEAAGKKISSDHGHCRSDLSSLKAQIKLNYDERDIRWLPQWWPRSAPAE